METIKKLAELIPFLEPYPTWVKVLVGAWTLMSAVLALALLFAAPKKKEVVSRQLSGRVVSTSGAGISSAAVEITVGGSKKDTTCDSDGIFTVDITGLGDAVNGRIRIAANGFRVLDKVIQLTKDSTDLGRLALAPDGAPAASEPTDPVAQIQTRLNALLESPADLLGRYQSIVAAGNAGVVKLLSNRAVLDNKGVLTQLPGEGRYYSFVRRDHSYGRGSDIEFDNGRLSTGFAGLDYGYILNVGAASFEDLARASAEPPSWLASAKREAWRFMWTYAPPNVTVDVRRAQREARNKVIAATPVSDVASPVAGTAYLLRAIEYNDSDLIVGLRAERFTDDGSVVLAWRILHAFDTPVATGPEPEQ